MRVSDQLVEAWLGDRWAEVEDTKLTRAHKGRFFVIYERNATGRLFQLKVPRLNKGTLGQLLRSLAEADKRAGTNTVPGLKKEE